MRRALLALIAFATLGAVKPEAPFDPIIRPRKRGADGSDEYPYDDNDPGVDVDEPQIADVILRCPKCQVRHVDLGEWKHRPHRTHLCLECGTLWRPSENYTRGV